MCVCGAKGMTSVNDSLLGSALGGTSFVRHRMLPKALVKRQMFRDTPLVISYKHPGYLVLLKDVFSNGMYYALTMGWIPLFICTLLVTMFIALIFFGCLVGLREGGIEPTPTLLSLYFWCMFRLVGVDGRFDAVSTPVEVLSVLLGFIGMLVGAIITGIFYARIMRARPPFKFADSIVITMKDNKRTLVARFANIRAQKETAQVEIELTVQLSRTTTEGEKINVSRTLPLVRENWSKLTHWPITVMSIIDVDEGDTEHPLNYVHNQKDVEDSRLDIYLSAKGLDVFQDAEVFGERVYETSEIHVGYKFEDQISSERDENGDITMRRLEFRTFSMIKQDHHWPTQSDNSLYPL